MNGTAKNGKLSFSSTGSKGVLHHDHIHAVAPERMAGAGSKNPIK
jgi:hypothetical protein